MSVQIQDRSLSSDPVRCMHGYGALDALATWKAAIGERAGIADHHGPEETLMIEGTDEGRTSLSVVREQTEPAEDALREIVWTPCARFLTGRDRASFLHDLARHAFSAGGPRP